MTLTVSVCRNFEILQLLISGELALLDRTNRQDTFALLNPVLQSLAKSVLFDAVRAARILEHAPSHVDVDRAKRKAILRDVSPFIIVRDLNEHWLDPTGKRREPTVHHHPELGVAADEVSMVILGSDHIILGNVNLKDLYSSFVSLLSEIMEADGEGSWRGV
jgi:hypothetical protein